jgi:hypothetical protein
MAAAYTFSSEVVIKVSEHTLTIKNDQSFLIRTKGKYLQLLRRQWN